MQLRKSHLLLAEIVLEYGNCKLDLSNEILKFEGRYIMVLILIGIKIFTSFLLALVTYSVQQKE